MSGARADPWNWAGATAVVATMHGKAAAITPALAPLGLGWMAPPAGFDTDRFGTFTREVARAGDQIEAARAKALAALDACPLATVAVASEGSFGPHPALGLVPGGHELVLLRTRDGRELVGRDLTFDTNYAQADLDSVEAAQRFAERMGFPEHGLILMTPGGGAVIDKDLRDEGALLLAVSAQIARSGFARLETDMRAHRNPRRMAAIARAAADLAQRWAARCPNCGAPGWLPVSEGGLPCADCGTPTDAPWRELFSCTGCGHHEAREIDGARRADPGLCPDCNP